MNYLIFSLLFFSGSVFASNFFVSASVDRNSVALNESFTLSIKIEYKKNKPKNIIIPDLSQLDDFNVLSQWSGTQTSMNLVNGKTTWSSTYSRNYQLQPKAKGKLRLDSIKVKLDGEGFETKPLFIEVTEKTKNQKPSYPLNPLNPFNIPNSRLLDPFLKDGFFRGRPQNALSKNAFKLKLILSKKSAYVGELIKADWILWMSLGSAQYRVHQTPELKGFWKEYLTDRAKPQFLGTQIEGDILYRKTLLDSQALFPVKSGVLTLDPYEVKVLSPFGIQWKEIVRKSELKNIVVKPLPKKGKENFSGAVGSFKVKASLNQAETKVNQPVAFRLRFEGDGHPRLIQMPLISFPEGLKAYPPTEKSQFSKKQSYKEFEVLLAPEKAGHFTLPSFSLTTFDPIKEIYIKHTIPTFKIKVKAGKNNVLNKKLSFFEQDKETGKEKLSFSFLDKEKWLSFFNQRDFFKFWTLLYSLLILLFIVVYFYPTQSKKKKALKKKVHSKLKKIEQILLQKDEKTVAVLLSNLVHFVLSELSSMKSSQEWSKLIEHLPPSLYHTHSKDLIKLMQELESLSFAPQRASSQAPKRRVIFREAKRLMAQMVEF